MGQELGPNQGKGLETCPIKAPCVGATNFSYFGKSREWRARKRPENAINPKLDPTKEKGWKPFET